MTDQPTTTPPPEPVFDARSAEVVLRENLRNIVKKAAAGAPLTKFEMDVLQRNGEAGEKRKTVYDGIHQCAGATGFSLSALRAAKRAGAPGFRAARIHWAELEPWLQAAGIKPGDEAAATPRDKSSAADLRIKRARAERLEMANAKARGELVAADEVMRMMVRVAVTIRTRMLAIPQASAARCALMTDPGEVEEHLRAAIIDALSELSKLECTTEKPTPTPQPSPA